MCVGLLIIGYCPPNPFQVENSRLKKWIPTGTGCEIQSSFTIYFSSVNQIIFRYMELLWVPCTYKEHSSFTI